MNPDSQFETHRTRLFALAYRLLGSRSDGDDLVQDAWLRWQAADHTTIRDPQAWLITVTTRLGLDRLRAARSSRIDYIGPWLPEPLQVIDAAPDPAAQQENDEQISLALLALLERLGPEERAAFLLKEAFDYDYARIAQMLGHSESGCRQWVHRARTRLRTGRSRFAATPEQHRQLLHQFMLASQSGDHDAIVALLTINARLISDGGGQVRAALRPLHGAERIARLYAAIARRSLTLPARLGQVNGEPAILRFNQHHRLTAITLIVIEEGRITDVLNLMNPNKLPSMG